ncbi:hypothetical protein F5888DRAFT_1722170, partial [Russula emetica]
MFGAMKIPCFLTVILLLPLLANAYCIPGNSPLNLSVKTLSLSVQGSGGQTPYSLLIIPTGSSPLGAPGVPRPYCYVNAMRNGRKLNAQRRICLRGRRRAQECCCCRRCCGNGGGNHHGGR